jgi:DNA-binding NarL/FixJ family response regulator
MPARREAAICTAQTARFAKTCACCHRPRLSQRHVEIIRLLARGYTNAKIGYELKISANTVKEHLWQLNQRFDLRSRTELVVWALKQRVIAVRDLDPAQCAMTEP